MEKNLIGPLGVGVLTISAAHRRLVLAIAGIDAIQVEGTLFLIGRCAS